MSERDARATSQSQPPAPSAPPTPQAQESGWFTALKSLFWLIVLPTIVLLLIRWMMQG
jgi:hypothetical protein